MASGDIPGCRGGRVATALTPQRRRSAPGAASWDGRSGTEGAGPAGVPAGGCRTDGRRAKSAWLPGPLEAVYRLPTSSTRARGSRQPSTDVPGRLFVRARTPDRDDADRSRGAAVTAPSGCSPRRLRRVPTVLGGTTICLLLGMVGRPAAASEGAWQWPIAGRSGTAPAVVRGFQAPATPYGPGHRGVDLAGSPGQPVTAAGDGVITVAGEIAGRGVVVVVHGPLRTTYEPVADSVRVGQRVTRGQVVGTLAAGHAGCGPPGECLHWGLLRGGDYLDPLSLMRPGPARLLPIWGAGPSPAVAGTAVVGLRSAAAPIAVQEAPDRLPAPAPASSDRLRLSAWSGPAGGIAIAGLLAGVLLLARGPRRRPPGSDGRFHQLRRRGLWRRAPARRSAGRHRARAWHPAGRSLTDPDVVDLEKQRSLRRTAVKYGREPG